MDRNGSARSERPAALRAASAVLVGLAACVLVGLVVLWPGDVDAQLSAGLTAPTDQGTVEEVQTFSCPPPQPGSCGAARVELEGGDDTGELVTVALGTADFAPDLEQGDSIRLTAAEGAGGTTTYTFADFERRTPLLLLAIAFAALVIVFGRLRGALSLLGLALSLALIVLFIAPAILDGKPPLAVALVGSLAVMLATISLAHGLGAKSVAAMLGTSLSLVLVVLLALAFTELSHLTGLASEEATLLNLNVAEISFDGLLVAGMVVGALGVLDDVTVSQASTVIALRAANPELGFGELFGHATRVGRDHVSATVNTLVLAYVGASLPVLLLFSAGGIGFSSVLNTELVATEVVAMLVGSIGLIAAVPLTTALATALARAIPPERLPRAAHAH